MLDSEWHSFFSAQLAMASAIFSAINFSASSCISRDMRQHKLLTMFNFPREKNHKARFSSA